MGLEVQKVALPTLFHLATVRAASQPHVVRKVKELLAGITIAQKLEW